MKNILCTAFILLIFSCARIGSPDGGPIDKNPPKVLYSLPDSMAKNVSTELKEIKIYFDKWIKLKDPSKQLIISPAIEKIKKIIPSSTPNNYVLIQWEDSLKANTTYNFNFGNSIIDNNEGNVLPYYQLIFSTGSTIDSLYISGYVDDILKPRKNKDSDEQFSRKNQEKNIVVGLYKIEPEKEKNNESKNENDEESKIEEKDNNDNIYTKKPYYITQVESDGYFELNYLASGDYLLIAFQDENQNIIYDSGKESIAFLTDTLHIGKDINHISGLRLLLSPPRKKHRFIEMKSIDGGLGIIFEGKPDSLQLKHIDNVLSEFKVEHKSKSDTAFVWIKPNTEDFPEGVANLKFSYFNEQKQKIDTISTFFKPNEKDELKLSNISGAVIPPETSLKIKANMSLNSIDLSKWELKAEADSTLALPFKAEISKTNPFEISVNANMKTGERYKLLVGSESVSSHYYNNTKAILFNFEIGKNENYGSLVFRIKNLPKSPFWIQLLDDNFNVKKEQKIQGKNEIKFSNLESNTYSVRILVDNNNNGIWDGADFENRIQPEEAYLFKKKLTVKPLWEIVEDWDLADKSVLNEDTKESLMPSSSGIMRIDEREKSNQNRPEENTLQNETLEQLKSQNSRKMFK